MNENIEILEYLHKASNIGHIAAENLLLELKEKDNKVKGILEDINKEYKHFEKESAKILKKHKKDPKDAGLMLNIMNKMGTKMEVRKDNSDSSIAETLIQGLNMGNLEIDKRISSFEKEIDRDILKLAKQFKNFGELYIKKLKDYL